MLQSPSAALYLGKDSAFEAGGLVAADEWLSPDLALTSSVAFLDVTSSASAVSSSAALDLHAPFSPASDDNSGSLTSSPLSPPLGPFSSADKAAALMLDEADDFLPSLSAHARVGSASSAGSAQSSALASFDSAGKADAFDSTADLLLGEPAAASLLALAGEETPLAVVLNNGTSGGSARSAIHSASSSSSSSSSSASSMVVAGGSDPTPTRKSLRPKRSKRVESTDEEDEDEEVDEDDEEDDHDGEEDEDDQDDEDADEVLDSASDDSRIKVNESTVGLRRGRKRTAPASLLPSKPPRQPLPAHLDKKEKNKISAARYRRNKKKMMSELEQRVMTLQKELNSRNDEMKNLKSQNKFLTEQLAFLKNIVSSKSSKGGMALFVLFTCFLITAPLWNTIDAGLKFDHSVSGRVGRSLLASEVMTEQGAADAAHSCGMEYVDTIPPASNLTPAADPPSAHDGVDSVLMSMNAVEPAVDRMSLEGVRVVSGAAATCGEPLVVARAAAPEPLLV